MTNSNGKKKRTQAKLTLPFIAIAYLNKGWSDRACQSLCEAEFTLRGANVKRICKRRFSGLLPDEPSFENK